MLDGPRGCSLRLTETSTMTPAVTQVSAAVAQIRSTVDDVHKGNDGSRTEKHRHRNKKSEFPTATEFCYHIVIYDSKI